MRLLSTSTAAADPGNDMFDVVGDPNAVPDALFDALAALLLSIDHQEPKYTEVRSEVQEADARS
jgi:hypothetical protein